MYVTGLNEGKSILGMGSSRMSITGCFFFNFFLVLELE